MIAGVAQFELHMPYHHSLKEKRQSLRKVKEKVLARFNVSLAEVEFLDKWQRAGLGFAVVGNEGKLIESTIRKILDFIETMQVGELINERQETLYFE